MNDFYSGTSGLVLPGPKESFPAEYQKGSRLEYYGSLFNSIEINSSFYKIPLKRTVAKWSDSVPDNFRLTFKFPGSITHEKGKDISTMEIESFMNVINEVGQKAGCILVQFPPGSARNIYGLEKILEGIKSFDLDKWITALEFRNVTWYEESTYRLMENFNASLVIHDIPGKSPPADEYESETIYLRFHGPGGKYRGSYEDDYLEEYAGYIKNYLSSGKSVYAYFNNTMGDALSNLLTLNKFITCL